MTAWLRLLFRLFSCRLTANATVVDGRKVCTLGRSADALGGAVASDKTAGYRSVLQFGTGGPPRASGLAEPRPTVRSGTSPPAKWRILRCLDAYNGDEFWRFYPGGLTPESSVIVRRAGDRRRFSVPAPRSAWHCCPASAPAFVDGNCSPVGSAQRSEFSCLRLLSARPAIPVHGSRRRF